MGDLKKKVLVVDDDEVIRKKLIEFLEFSGYEGIGAENGQRAMELFLKDTPDLIIADIHMPIMNGFQLLRAVKRINRGLPVIFITGFTHFRRFFSDNTAQADGFLEKPFSLEALDVLVKKFI